MPFSSYRLQFPFSAHKIYLNHAAVSPIPTDARERMDWFINNRSFGEIEFYDEIKELVEQTRFLLANLVNSETANIGFTSNTSEGLNWLAQGLRWKKGDQIILSDIEFPANVYPFMNLQQKGVELVFVKSKKGCVDVADIEKAITPKTRLISISFVEFLSGYRNDMLAIGALCKKHNIIYSVDAIQGLGAIPLDVKQWHIDFLSCGGHKWLMGPMGIGFVYVNHDLLEKLAPPFAGWLGVKNAWDFFDYKLDFLPGAQRFEYATQNYLGICGLLGSLELLTRAGIAAIEQHLLILGKQLVDRLPDFNLKFVGAEDPFYWSGIYTFAGKKSQDLFEFLKTNNIICGLREGHLRFAAHLYNTRDEINEVINVIERWHIEKG